MATRRVDGPCPCFVCCRGRYFSLLLFCTTTVFVCQSFVLLSPLSQPLALCISQSAAHTHLHSKLTHTAAPEEHARRVKTHSTYNPLASKYYQSHLLLCCFQHAFHHLSPRSHLHLSPRRLGQGRRRWPSRQLSACPPPHRPSAHERRAQWVSAPTPQEVHQVRLQVQRLCRLSVRRLELGRLL